MFNPDYLISSGNYAEVMDSVVLPALKERETQTTLAAADGTSLYCVSYAADQPAGTVLVLHGFTENAYKYAELIYSLLNSHFLSSPTISAAMAVPAVRTASRIRPSPMSAPLKTTSAIWRSCVTASSGRCRRRI